MGRRIVITGATHGCGRALAELWLAGGHAVHGCGRSRGEIAALAAAAGADSSFHVVDVARDAEVAAWAQTVLARFGPPDLVLNNAGRINASAPLWRVSAEEFSAVVGANLEGPAAVLRAFLPAMIERGRGVVVNFSSGWGRGTAPEVAPYCATKWAIEGLTGALAQELPPGLAAVALNPGIIDTRMLRSCFGSAASTYPRPASWALTAGPFLLALGAEHNGRSLDVPG